SGFLSEHDLLTALSEQLKLPLIDLRRASPTEEALKALPESVVRATTALPMRVADEGVAVAMAGPPSPEGLAELDTAAGTRISVVPAPERDVLRLIDRWYRAMAGMDRIVEAYAGDAATAATASPALELDESAPVVQVVQRIVTEAVRDRASDIHIEPQDTS